MKIKFIRNGFANNSSSSHSIIFSKKNFGKMSDQQDDYGFGWNNFTCASRESKEEYLLNLLICNYSDWYKTDSIFYKSKRSIGKSDWHCKPIVCKKENKIVLSLNKFDKIEDYIREVLSEDFKQFGYDKLFTTYDYLIEKYSESFDSIDHQSVLKFPYALNTKQYHVGFVKDLIKTILENEFAILGGNDNDCDDHEYLEYNDGHELISILTKTKYDKLSVAFDSKNGDYILQNQSNGSLIRFSFENKYETTKAEFPTLVDISITSYCAKGCKFCYQSSTRNGTHSDVSFVKSVLDELVKNGCLEVVFGGGEPTKHPNFLEIVKYAKSLGLVVGVTTKNHELHNIPNVQEILDNVNSIAFSCNNIPEANQGIEMFGQMKETKNTRKNEFYFQTILGLNPLPELIDMVEHIKNDSNYYFDKNLTLLGYKDFGFGKNQSAHDVDGWIEQIKEAVKGEYDNISVGIDSIVVKAWREQLIEAGVDYRNLVGEEGKFSCYIDCVEKKISASSFTDTKFDFDSNWLSTFKSF